MPYLAIRKALVAYLRPVISLLHVTKKKSYIPQKILVQIFGSKCYWGHPISLQAGEFSVLRSKNANKYHASGVKTAIKAYQSKLTPNPGQVTGNLPRSSVNPLRALKDPEEKYHLLPQTFQGWKLTPGPGQVTGNLTRPSPNPYVIMKVYTNLSRLKIDTRPGSSHRKFPPAQPQSPSYH